MPCPTGQCVTRSHDMPVTDVTCMDFWSAYPHAHVTERTTKQHQPHTNRLLDSNGYHRKRAAGQSHVLLASRINFHPSTPSTQDKIHRKTRPRKRLIIPFIYTRTGHYREPSGLHKTVVHFFHAMNLVDLLALVPYYVRTLVERIFPSAADSGG